MTQKAPANRSRREFYRIDEKLLLSYKRLIADEEVEKESDIESMALFDEFSTMSQQIKLSLSRMHYQSPEVSTCFKIMDAKINLLAQSIFFKENKNVDMMRRKVSISGGGISFEASEMIEDGGLLEIEIILPPEVKSLKLKATVVKSFELKHGIFTHVVATKFEGVNKLTQDAIVRHIMQAQSHLLRLEKEAKTTKAANYKEK